MVPRDTPVKLVCGLVAPDEARPHASAPIAAGTLPRRTSYFHPATVAGHRGENWSENTPSSSTSSCVRLGWDDQFPDLVVSPEGHEQLLKKCSDGPVGGRVGLNAKI
jgi:hypothetical protein